jgi:hypothetical protein
MNTNQFGKPILAANQPDIPLRKPIIWYCLMNTNQFGKPILAANQSSILI